MYTPERVPDGYLQRHVARYGRRLSRELRLGLPFALAARVVTAIQQDAVDPGGQSGIEMDGARRSIYFLKRFLHGILLGPEPSALNGATSKCLLVRGELYFHGFRVLEAEQDCSGFLKSQPVMNPAWISAPSSFHANEPQPHHR